MHVQQLSQDMYGTQCSYNGYGVLGTTDHYIPNTVVVSSDASGSMGMGGGYIYGTGMPMAPQSMGSRDSYQTSALPLVPQMYSYLPMQFVPMQIAPQMYPPSAVAPFGHAQFPQQYGLPYGPYWNYVSPIQTANPSVQQLNGDRQSSIGSETYGPEAT